MDVRILGSLTVRENGTELVPSAPKLRQLMALLLVNESKRVPSGALVAELWDDAPPPTVMTTLQTHVLRLRRELAARLRVPLETVTRELLQTRDGGYLLALPDTRFDLGEYRALDSAGRDLLRDADVVGAIHRFAAALDQWRGPALMDVEQGRMLRAAVTRLDHSRLETVMRLIDAQLKMGRHREILRDLAQLSARHAFHQDVQARFMLALHRSGRRVDALNVFGRLERDMREELGAAPCVELNRLRDAIQASDEYALECTGGLGRCVPTRYLKQ